MFDFWVSRGMITKMYPGCSSHVLRFMNNTASRYPTNVINVIEHVGDVFENVSCFVGSRRQCGPFIRSTMRNCPTVSCESSFYRLETDRLDGWMVFAPVCVFDRVHSEIHGQYVYYDPSTVDLEHIYGEEAEGYLIEIQT